MNYTETAGRTLLGLGALGLGVINLLHADFAITWEPVPDWVPMRTALAYASGALLSAAGAALIINRGARIAAAFIAAFLTFWGIVLRAPVLLARQEAAWLHWRRHIAAGFAIVLNVIPRIGATLLATMFGGFVLLVHTPRVIGDLDNRTEWHLLSTALLLTGAAWIVASALARSTSPKTGA